MTTVIVGGAVANKPFNGGEAWVRLSWISGLRKLGFHACFVEQISPGNCVDAAGEPTTFEDSINLAHFERTVEQFDLPATLIYGSGEKTSGMAFAELLDLAEDADLLVNISGHLTLEPLMRRIRRKAYVDIDPGFTQFWHAAGEMNLRAGGHDFFFTIGENIGSPSCPIPTKDIHWRPTRQPVVLEEWPVSEEGERFTTVASWRGPYGVVEYGGKTFGLKVHEFRKFIGMPERSPGTFEVALDIHPAEARDLDLLHHHGWRIADPKTTVPDPDSFRRYVRSSGAEFSVAQGIYVETGSGWFSDRTVRYLASGKPALVQNTGFDLPIGDGLLAFRTMEEAVAGAEEIVRDHEHHARAAREIAEAYFDSEKILGRFIEEVGVAP